MPNWPNTSISRSGPSFAGRLRKKGQNSRATNKFHLDADGDGAASQQLGIQRQGIVPRCVLQIGPAFLSRDIRTTILSHSVLRRQGSSSNSLRGKTLPYNLYFLKLQFVHNEIQRINQLGFYLSCFNVQNKSEVYDGLYFFIFKSIKLLVVRKPSAYQMLNQTNE